MDREEVEKILIPIEWFVVKTKDDDYANDWLIKFDYITDETVFASKCVDLDDSYIEPYNENGFCDFKFIIELRPATKEEVLKYFPDEVFPEPKERFKVPIIKAPLLKDELKDIMEALRHKDILYFESPDFKALFENPERNTPRKRPITRNKVKNILKK